MSKYIKKTKNYFDLYKRLGKLFSEPDSFKKVSEIMELIDKEKDNIKSSDPELYSENHDDIYGEFRIITREVKNKIEEEKAVEGE